ncbi:VOC family protein [Streptomyces otsuchiensis]|uniref:VOC family protein n=1 Tax=Streptomyces otsuchiensis TaxID=2681388 RepID=UPI00103202FC|nr:VOC family protein [Streptomyces otsuchiensis]
MAVAVMGPVVLDCPEPRKLSEFYAAVLGWPEDQENDPDWVELTGPAGQKLAFQRSPGYRPPEWPGVEHPQQLHLDLEIPKGQEEEAERAVLALGATLLQGQVSETSNFRVYADPAGHPFCLCAC